MNVMESDEYGVFEGGGNMTEEKVKNQGIFSMVVSS